MNRRAKATRLMNRSLMHTAAKLHFMDGVSQLEVARRMQVSTATVSRLLARAREDGIVRIHVADLDETDEMGDALCSALGLSAVRVLDSGKAASLSPQVGALLTEADLPPGSVIAIGWGRTVQSVIYAGLPAVPKCIVVPTIGGINETASHFQINEFVRNAAEQMQGTPKFLYAPSQPSAELRRVLIRDPDIAQIMDKWSKASAAVVGIGDIGHSTSLRSVDFGHENAQSVVGDVARSYFGENGEEISWPGLENMVAISRNQLRQIPLCIGVAIGKEKVKAIIGAARSGMITTLVTDTNTALLILDALNSPA